MALNKAQLMDVPGGPGVTGSVKAGSGISIASDGTISISSGAGFLPLSGGTMTGNIVTAPGSVTSPSIQFGKPDRGFYSVSQGLAYARGQGNITSMIIDADGQMILGDASAAINQTYGGAIFQVWTNTGQGNGAGAVFGATGLSGADASSITLVSCGGTVSAPIVKSTGDLGRLRFGDPSSSSNLTPQARAEIIGFKEVGTNTWLKFACSTATSPNPIGLWQIQFGAIRPQADNAYGVGTTNFRPNQICAVSPVINTSDSSLKKNINPLDEGFGLDFISSLNPVTYQFITEYNDVVPNQFTPEDSSKFTLVPVPGYTTHFGFLADQVSQALLLQGIVSESGNGLVGQNKDLPPTITDGSTPAQLDQYWLRPVEIIPCAVKAIQQLSEQLENLQAAFDTYVASHP